MKQINKINDPFGAFCVSLGCVPSVYDEALTYEEQLLWFLKYLRETIIPAVQDDQEAIVELQGLYTQLEDYVNHYFDNLDVQEEINNKLDDMVSDGTLAEVINQEIFGEINNNIEKLDQFVTIEEFKQDGDVDDTNAFILAVADGRPIYLLDKNYYVSSTITLTEQTRIIGKSMTDSIINASQSDYMFEYISEVHDSGYDHKVNFELNNFKVTCKNFIKINDNTLEDNNFIKQARLLHLTFKNLWIYGIYNSITDNNKDSNVLPDISTLLGYGCGMNLNLLFDSIIENCRIENFGLGIYLKGCDLNLISNNRIHSNGCHIYLERVSTFGSQNRIVHNDILHNLRYGGIRDEGCNFNNIEDNYFETYTPSACHIYANNERGLSIINNRFDNPTQSDIDIIRLAPNNSDLIINNRINPSSASNRCYLNIIHDNLSLSNANNLFNLNSAYVKNNNTKLELRNNPFIYNDIYNPLLISPYNVNFEYNMITGNRFVSPYVKFDLTDNLYYFLDDTEAGTSLSIRFKQLKKIYAKYPTLRFKYKSSEYDTMSVKVQGDGNTIYNTTVSIVADDEIHTVDLDLTSNEVIYDLIRIDLPVKAGVKLYSVELI